MRNALLGVVLPGFVSLTVLLAAWWPRRAATGSRRGAWGGALAFAVAPCATFLALAGWPTWPPAERWHRVALLAAACGVVGVAAARVRRPMWAPLTAGPIAILIGLLLLEPPDAPVHAALGPVALAAVALVTWAGLEGLARRRPGVSLPLILLIANIATVVVLVQSRNALLAMHASALAAAAAAALVTTGVTRRFSLACGAMAVAAPIGTALPFLGAWYDYGPLPAAVFPLVAVAPLAAWGAELRRFRRLRPGRRLLLRVTLVAIPAAVAVVLALRIDSDSPSMPFSRAPGAEIRLAMTGPGETGGPRLTNTLPDGEPEKSATGN